MDTIFALSSGKGKAGVSIIRISGTISLQALQAFGVGKIPPRTANLRKLKNQNGQTIDHALVISFNKPASFTGEDVVEFHVHGSKAIISEMLEILSNIEGFRSAEPGEFSKRAFENGKMDLLQAEGLADLIDSETKSQKAQAIRQMEGVFSNIYEDWRARIIEIMAFIEAYVDFPDEDIPNDLDQQAQEKIAAIISEINKQINNTYAEKVRDGLNIAIIGKPNVGKSTLINFLTNRDLAIVSEIAGTTRDSLEAHFEISGMPVILIDTAGIREAEDEIEIEGVKRAIDKAKKADFKIYMLSAEDKNLDISSHDLVDEKTLVIINKTDLGKSDSLTKIGLQSYSVIETSLKSGEGKQNIIDALGKIAEDFSSQQESGIITRSRHRALLNDVVNQLSSFNQSRKNNLPIELSAETLRFASHSIGKIIGKIDVEDVLDKIFSDFCIGK